MDYVTALEILIAHGAGKGRHPSARLSAMLGTIFYIRDAKGALIARVSSLSRRVVTEG